MSARLLTYGLPLVALLATLVAWWGSPNPLPRGVVGRYYANDSWSGAPIVERIESEISTETLATHPELRALPAFTAEWTGSLLVEEPHLLRFATKSDDGSWLWIDEQLVVDNGGTHGPLNVMREVFLDRGVHAFRVRYLEAGGGSFLLLGQSASDGVLRHPGPLIAKAVSQGEVRVRQLWPLGLVALWYAALLAIGAAVLGRVSREADGRFRIAALRDPWFVSVAVVGIALAGLHIDYGLASYSSYSGDELMPLDTLDASRYLFRDWNLRWPSGQPALIALLLQPFVWAATAFGLPLGDPTVAAILLLVLRAFSLLLLFLTFALVFDIASRLHDRTAALFAVALLALAPVVVYFGPLANLEIPQLFWVTASWWAWLMFVKDQDLFSSILFGAVVGFSLAVKDQTYGYYLAAPFAVCVVLRKVHDRRVYAIGLATLGAFAIGQGLPWAWDRFGGHVVEMMGPASKPFRTYAHSPSGMVGLLVGIGRTFIWAAGIPLAVAFAGGVIEEVLSNRRRRLAALMIPLATYAIGFLAVIGYVYDRFLIGVLPVAAVVGGMFFRSLVNLRTVPAVVRLGIPALLLAMGVVNAVAQNIVFRGDARYAAGEWMARHLPCTASVGVTYDSGYVPSLGCYDVWRFLPSHTESAVRWPDYFVLSEGYAQRFLATDAGARFIRRLVTGDLGYRLVFRSEAQPPSWAPLYWENRFRNGREDPDTTLDKPINAIEVWQLTTAAR